MGKALDFDELWKRYQDNRTIAEGITEGNRCGIVLGLTLKNAFKPRRERKEMSFRDIGEPRPGMRGQPFLSKFYVKAEEMAARLREEWGEPDVKSNGQNAFTAISGKQGVVFVENAWRVGRKGPKTVDHVDLWNGSQMGAFTADYSKEKLAAAESVWLWLVPQIRLETTP